jgi:hypothetical protein
MLRSELHLPARSSTHTRSPPKDSIKELEPVYDAWLASREIPEQKGGPYLVAGAQRQVNLANLRLAYCIIQGCAFDFVKLFHFFGIKRLLNVRSSNFCCS